MRLTILYISPYLPCEGKSGAQSKMFNEIKILSQDNRIFVICFYTPKEHRFVKMLEGMGCKVYCFLLPHYRHIPTTYKGFLDRIRKVIEEIKPHIIQCEFSFMSEYLKSIKDIPKILVQHHISFVYLLRWIRYQKNLLFKVLLYLKVLKNLLDERRRLNYVDKVIFLSEFDKDIFLKWINKKVDVEVVPPLIDETFFYFPQEAPQYDACFIGNFEHLPNVDGIKFFIEEILPLVLRRYPRFKLVICGYKIPYFLRNKHSYNITLVEWPLDIKPYISKSKLFIVPIRFASGVRMKILEAWALKKPVISTSIGAEGLPVKHGENIIIADTPHDFCLGIMSLLRDSNMRTRIGDRALKSLKDNYSVQSYKDKIFSVYKKLLQKI